MKKILMLVCFFILSSGCGKYNKEDVIKDIKEKVKKSESYVLTGKLEIYRNEDLYTYDVSSSYKNKNNFKVNLTNTTNNHEQIILRSDDEVYVITPSLNKSFKFQSEWPYNNSQIYLLQPIINDLEADDNVSFKKESNNYILTLKANYINDKSLVKQKVYFDKGLNLKKVEVIDNNDDVVMRFKITKIEYNIKLANDEFDIKKYVKEEKGIEKKETDDKYQKKDNEDMNNNNDSTGNDAIDNNEEENASSKTSVETSNVNEVLYPMYVPLDTYLKTQDVLAVDDGSRTILTFSGERSFTLVQSTLSNVDNETVYGEPYMISDTVGVVNDYSVSWISNGQEFYLTSNAMDVDEMLLVAQSLSVTEVGK